MEQAEGRDIAGLVQKIDEKFRPVWTGRPPEEAKALAAYFLPHRSAKPVLKPTRPRMIKWYCPFAAQSDFPTGHRYCINVYTGCAHRCVYCYAAAYMPGEPSQKMNFERLLARDIEDLEQFDVSAAPVHLSNSTDPFQPLEAEAGNTKFALEQVLAHRERFTTVVILTKNPLLPVEHGYLGLFRELGTLPQGHPNSEEFRRLGLPAFCVEVSLTFWREEPRSVYDPNAPSIEERKAGIRALAKAGIPIVLRIDPLFPRSPLREDSQETLADFGLPEAQTIEDLENLVHFAREMHVRHVVYSPTKIVKPRGRQLSETMQAMRVVYERVASPGRLVWRSNSWRLPPAIATSKVVQPFLEICRREGVRAVHCMQNLIDTP